MLTLRSDVLVPGVTGTQITDFLLAPTDHSYRRWWPGTHLRFQIVQAGSADHRGDVVLVDEFVGTRRLRFFAVVVAVTPGRRIVWRLGRRIPLPIRLILDLTERAGGVAVRHTIVAGSSASGTSATTAARTPPSPLPAWRATARAGATPSSGAGSPTAAPRHRRPPRSRSARGPDLSTDKKLTRRRDADPVRVYADGRLAYWTGGRSGLGKREWERLGTRENAEARAARLRELLRRGLDRTAPKADAGLDEMVQDALDTLRAESAPEGTVRQYRSEWNATCPPDRCGPVRGTGIWDYTRVFSELLQGNASERVVKNVARTLGHVIQFGVDHGYFDGHEPFGTPTQRKGLVRKYRKKAAAAQAEGAKRITLDVCPTVSGEEYATAFEMGVPRLRRAPGLARLRHRSAVLRAARPPERPTASPAPAERVRGSAV